MPPKTRSTRSTKNLKENIGVVNKVNKRAVGKVVKPARKALADKTNSASDDNTSAECQKELLNKPSVIKEQSKSDNEDQRPRRDRRLPNRFVENQVLKRLSLTINNESAPISPVSKPASDSINSSTASTFKTPPKPAETSLVANRPRRVCRLPSKFEDHSISPNKFIPVQPAYASTPIAQKTAIPKQNEEGKKSSKSEQAKVLPSDKKGKKKNTVKKGNEKSIQNKSMSESKLKVSSAENNKKAASDSNNNAFKKNLRSRKLPVTESKAPKNDKSTKTPTKAKSPVKSVSPKKVVSPKKAVSPKKNKPLNFSFKVLEDNKKQESNNKDDVYEFTFDPSEEPPPQKKKKRVVKKKPAKPKTVVFKNNYDKNVNKALAALKNVVSKKHVEDFASKAPIPVEKVSAKDNVIPQEKTMATTNTTNGSTSIPQIQRNVASKIIIGGFQSPKQNGTQTTQVQSHNKTSPKILSNKVTVPERNESIQVEDIAADFDIPDLNYSPVNSPNIPNTTDVPNQTPSRSIHSTDPLKLREHISFFDDNPVASSSMNTSTRQPQASPWRVEFENLPIRWHVNSYVKPNMTPAVECSFVNFDDKNKKKHVYTNLVPESNDTLPEIVEKEQPNLIQTSIISFIREAMEKSSSKKKREKSVTPAPLFLDSTNKTPNKNGETVKNPNTGKASRQLFTPKKVKSADSSNASNETNTSSDKENGRESMGQKRKNLEEITEKPAKTPRKDKDNSFFGFDDSENVDQENISPKKNGRKRTLRPRSRAILKELNEPSGPTRAIVPVAAKTARKAEIEKLYEEMKSATDAPVFPDKEMDNVATTDVDEVLDEILNEEDSNSVHLFEDIEVVHHTKPQRKSYGKAKVTFRRVSSDSTTQETGKIREDSDDEEDLNDLTFDPGVPFIEEKRTRKKQTKRQKMTKKEAEEAEAWAANFNSMCEDVEEFALVVE